MNPKLTMTGAMLIFSTIGIFVRSIPLPSALIACVRGVVGAGFLAVVLRMRGKKLSLSAVRQVFFMLVLSGGVIGVNWILLFEAYRRTTVAVATLCYYMAPVFVILLSPLFFHETLTRKKLLCVAAALFGTVLISGVLQNQASGASFAGVAFGLCAAVFYSMAVMMNKILTGVPPYEKTIVQLLSASMVVIPYLLCFVPLEGLSLTGQSAVLLLFVGVVHTGIAYALYFSSISQLPAQTVALYSYIDPIGAVLISALVLHEPLHAAEAVGSVLILGAAWLSENSLPKFKMKRSHTNGD